MPNHFRKVSHPQSLELHIPPYSYLLHGTDGVRNLRPENVDDRDGPDQGFAIVGRHELAKGERLQLRGRGVLQQG